MEWPNQCRTGDGNEPVTQPKKKQKRLNSQEPHCYTRDAEQERSRQSFDFVQKVCITEDSKKFKLVEVSGALLDSTDRIAHSSSSDFKLATSFSSRFGKHSLPRTSSLARKRRKRKLMHNKNFFLDSLISWWSSHYFVTKRLLTLRAALEATLQHAQTLNIEKVSIQRLSTGLDNLNWFKVRESSRMFSTTRLSLLCFMRNAAAECQSRRESMRKRNKEWDATSTRGQSDL